MLMSKLLHLFKEGLWTGRKTSHLQVTNWKYGTGVQSGTDLGIIGKRQQLLRENE